VIASVVMMKITDQLGTTRGRYDEYSSKIFPSVRNQGFIVQEEKAKLKKVMLVSIATAPDNL
jgi:hypothetical protein